MDCKDSWHLDLLYSSPPNSCIPRHRQLRFLQLFVFVAICGHDPKESGGRGDLSGKNDDNGDNDDDGDDHERWWWRRFVVFIDLKTLIEKIQIILIACVVRRPFALSPRSTAWTTLKNSNIRLGIIGISAYVNFQTLTPIFPSLWQAWSETEGNLQALHVYCLSRFQRNRGTRQAKIRFNIP